MLLHDNAFAAFSHFSALGRRGKKDAAVNALASPKASAAFHKRAAGAPDPASSGGDG